MRYYIGIDLGLNGGFALLSDEVKTLPMPRIKTEIDYGSIHEIIHRWNEQSINFSGKPAHVVFEKLGLIFKSSKATALSMGFQSGAVEMVCISLGIPFTKVTPKTWQREMFTGIEAIYKPQSSSLDTKRMALICAGRIFPDLKFTFSDRARKPHDGLIDALLLAEYGRRRNL